MRNAPKIQQVEEVTGEILDYISGLNLDALLSQSLPSKTTKTENACCGEELRLPSFKEFVRTTHILKLPDYIKDTVALVAPNYTQQIEVLKIIQEIITNNSSALHKREVDTTSQYFYSGVIDEFLDYTNTDPVLVEDPNRFTEELLLFNGSYLVGVKLFDNLVDTSITVSKVVSVEGESYLQTKGTLYLNKNEEVTHAQVVCSNDDRVLTLPDIVVPRLRGNL